MKASKISAQKSFFIAVLPVTAMRQHVTCARKLLSGAAGNVRRMFRVLIDGRRTKEASARAEFSARQRCTCALYSVRTTKTLMRTRRGAMQVLPGMDDAANEFGCLRSVADLRRR